MGLTFGKCIVKLSHCMLFEILYFYLRNKEVKMDYRLLRYFWGIVFFVFVASTAVSGQINHTLKVVLFPGSHRIEVVDTIILPETVDAWPIIFALHQNLNPKVLSEGAVLKKTGVEEGLEIFEITLPFGTHQFTIAYGG